MLQSLPPMPSLEMPHPRRARDTRMQESDGVQMALGRVESYHGAHGGLNGALRSALKQHNRLADLDSFQARVRTGSPAPLGALATGQDGCEGFAV